MDESISADEIREIRSRYRLSQKAFATLLGIGTSSLARYELGDTPSKANENLIRAAGNPEFMAERLAREGDKLSERQRGRTREVIYSFIELPPLDRETGPRNRLSDAKLEQEEAEGRSEGVSRGVPSERREETSEACAHLSCEIMEYMIERGIDARDQGNPVSLLLAQLLELKNALATECEQATDNWAYAEGYVHYLADYVRRLRAAPAEGSRTP